MSVRTLYWNEQANPVNIANPGTDYNGANISNYCPLATTGTPNYVSVADGGTDAQVGPTDNILGMSADWITAADNNTPYWAVAGAVAEFTFNDLSMTGLDFGYLTATHATANAIGTISIGAGAAPKMRFNGLTDNNNLNTFVTSAIISGTVILNTTANKGTKFGAHTQFADTVTFTGDDKHIVIGAVSQAITTVTTKLDAQTHSPKFIFNLTHVSGGLAINYIPANVPVTFTNQEQLAGTTGVVGINETTPASVTFSSTWTGPNGNKTAGVVVTLGGTYGLNLIVAPNGSLSNPSAGGGILDATI